MKHSHLSFFLTQRQAWCASMLLKVAAVSVHAQIRPSITQVQGEGGNVPNQG